MKKRTKIGAFWVVAVLMLCPAVISTTQVTSDSPQRAYVLSANNTTNTNISFSRDTIELALGLIFVFVFMFIGLKDPFFMFIDGILWVVISILLLTDYDQVFTVSGAGIGFFSMIIGAWRIAD